jgi:class 3 adenylate cyclase
MATKTENLAIVMTDIVDFTKITVGQSRSENEKLLDTHNRLLLPILRHYGGRHVKSIGDALLTVFKSPTDAMLCAMAMQDALFAHNQIESNHPIHIRIGASLGEVRVTRNDIFGEPVNLTSRVESITPADEIYLTEALYMAMNKAEVPAEEVGFKEIKGLKEPVRLYSIPRFAESRLVPQEVRNEDLEGLAYPYGGAHLSFSEELKRAKFRIPNNLVSFKRPPGLLVVVPILLLIAIPGLYVMGKYFDSNTEPETVETTAPQTVKLEASSTSDKTPTDSENPNQSTTQTVTDAKAEAEAEAAKSSAAVDSAQTVAQPVSLKLNLVSLPNDQHGPPSIAKEEPEAEKKKESKPQPKWVWTVRKAKLAYRNREIDKAQYNKIIYNLKTNLRANIQREKERYRAREIDKVEYKRRVRKLEADYKG